MTAERSDADHEAETHEPEDDALNVTDAPTASSRSFGIGLGLHAVREERRLEMLGRSGRRQRLWRSAR